MYTLYTCIYTIRTPLNTSKYPIYTLYTPLQIDGRIIDCAWTVSFDPTFDPLLEAAKESTYV